MKIAVKISLSFFITAIILTTVFASLFYIIVRNDFLNAVDNRLDALVYSRAKHIETYLNMLKMSIGQLSKSVVLENLLKADKKDYEEAFKVAMARLKRTREAMPSIAEFLLADRTGKIIASSDLRNIGGDISTDAFFAGGKDRIYIKDAYYSGALKMGVMGVSGPMIDSKTREFLGVLAARVDLKELNKIVTDNAGFGRTEEIFILNKYGYMITPSRFIKDYFLKVRVDTANSRACIANRAIGGACNLEKHMIIAPDYRGVMITGSNAYIPEMQWSVISKVDADEILAPLNIIRIVTIIIIIISPILAWFCGIFFASLITAPIGELRRGAEIIGNGNLDQRVRIETKDEIGQLSNAFNNMAAKLKHTTTSMDNLNKEIAQRKEAKHTLRMLAAIVESSDDAIIGKDLDGKIISWNKGAERLYGYTEKEAIGENVSIIVSEEHLRELGMIMRKIKENHPVEHFETVRRRKDGTDFPASLTISPIKDDDGSVIGASTIARDITERKRLEELLRRYSEELEKKIEERTHELRESQDKLVRSEKLAIVGKLASSVAHELRNPLGVIKNVVYYLNMLERAKEHPEVKENLDIITQEIENSDKIITDLLEFSRAKAPVFRPENINLIIKEVLNRIRIGPEIELVLELKEGLPEIDVDALQMHQVFYNLIKNAVEAMEKGGRLTIGTALEGEFIEVAISDTGSGISKENIAKIFEPLFSTKTKGTGLGLSVCSSLVERHNGKIEVDSEAGKGATFTVRLPIRRG